MRCALLGLMWAAAALAAGPVMTLDLRSRVEAFKGSGEWTEVRLERSLPLSETAILICDMWDKHWCSGATRRVDAMVKVMNPVLEEARERGVAIIHSPSDTMHFYASHPARLRILELAPVAPPAALGLTDPPLPIDDKDGGCDTGEKTYKAWTRQHSGLHIADSDAISDDGAQVYSFLRSRGIGNLLVMGVHTNMCILNRTFAIKRMTNLGVRCVLVRDLTDAMYDPQDRPFVSHERGTELVVEHIEKHWCPTTRSAQLVKALRQAR